MVAQLQEATMSNESLRFIMMDVLNNTDLTDPHEIAEEMLKRIPRKRYPEVLTFLLANYVRGYGSRERRSGPLPPVSSLPKVITSKHAGGVLTSKSTSAKVSAIRDGWQKHLRDRISVGHGAWKMLKDCTYDDLQHAAKKREQVAEANKAWAKRFHAYASLLTEYDVETFGELPVEVHLKVLGEAA